MKERGQSGLVLPPFSVDEPRAARISMCEALCNVKMLLHDIYKGLGYAHGCDEWGRGSCR